MNRIKARRRWGGEKVGACMHSSTCTDTGTWRSLMLVWHVRKCLCVEAGGGDSFALWTFEVLFKTYAFLPQMVPLYQFLHVLKYFFLVPMTCCRAHTLGLWGGEDRDGIWWSDKGSEKEGKVQVRRVVGAYEERRGERRGGEGRGDGITRRGEGFGEWRYDKGRSMCR